MVSHETDLSTSKWHLNSHFQSRRPFFYTWFLESAPKTRRQPNLDCFRTTGENSQRRDQPEFLPAIGNCSRAAIDLRSDLRFNGETDKRYLSGGARGAARIGRKAAAAGEHKRARRVCPPANPGRDDPTNRPGNRARIQPKDNRGLRVPRWLLRGRRTRGFWLLPRC